MNQPITVCGPRTHYSVHGVGQYIEAATAAYGAYSASKGGGAMTHEERVAARTGRVTQRAQAMGMDISEWRQWQAIADAEGVPRAGKAATGDRIEKFIASKGGLEAARRQYGIQPTVAPGASSPGVMTAGFGGGGGIPWLPIAIVAGLLVGPMLFKRF